VSQSIFFQLTPRLQQGIAHTLGWSSLRPVQELTIHAVVAGQNCIVLAPTAGGKTEAAFFPILDILAREKLAPVCALYISPIRALLNNQEPRLQQLTSLVGATAFKWHGDVMQSARKRFLADPSHILMTTPESLEVMLISPQIDTASLFAGLRFAVIDEIHSFAAGDRGAHLMAVLERLARYTPHDIQRIGLSATVGDPEVLGRWMQGSSRRPAVVINPAGKPAPRLIRIDFYNDDEELARQVKMLVQGRKTLFFVEGRRLAEGVKQALSEVAATTYVHHSAVGRELREEAEQAFTYGRDSQCIVCTSTMELGIDIGDLDAVIQLDAPATVSSLMQRMGRTGRRPGTQNEMNFFCGDETALLRAVALVNLARRGWIESVNPTQHAVHVLAHQILAQTLQFYGVRREQVWEVAQRARPFAEITHQEFDQLTSHLVETGILNAADGLLIMGEVGEKRYGRRNFLELYSVFETPDEIRVLTADYRVIGTLQAWFVQQIGSEEFVFLLAGRAWLVKHLDLENGEMIVIPAPKAAPPRWGGGGALLGREVAEEIRAILTTEEEYPFLTRRAQARLTAACAHWHDILHSAKLPIQQNGREWVLHTFAGDRINILLGRALAHALGCQVDGDSFSLRIKSPDHVPLQEGDLLEALTTVTQPEFFSAERVMAMGRSLPRGRLSKFQPLLPPGLEAQFLAERLFDIEGLQHWLRRAI
jgi:ATP-dependent helicase Lhr and Lhr-like helicase